MPKDAKELPAAGGRRSGDELRARRRTRIRAEIREIALKMFAESGYQNVNLEDISHEAEISPRTFFRYFDGKEDLLLDPETFANSVADALRSDPNVKLDIASMQRAIMKGVLGIREHDRHILPYLTKVMRQEPELRATPGFTSVVGEKVVPVFAELCGVDEHTDPAPYVIAGAVTSAVNAATLIWLTQGMVGSAKLDALYERAFEVLNRSSK